MPDIRLIIFDCDGVLVDSEPLAIRLMRDTLARHGLDIPIAEAYARFLGRSLGSVLADLESNHDLHLGPDDLERMRSELADLFRAELKPVPHVVDTVATLAKSHAICVASSSLPERLELSLGLTGLLPFFDGHVMSASAVTHGKPAPDLFQHAAARLGVPPEHCLVIEDSPAGIAAAQAAGMRVFGFTGGAHAAEAGLQQVLASANPDAVFDDMRDLPGLIAAEDTIPETRPQSSQPCLVAIDVGTATVRAGIVTPEGEVLARAERPIALWRQGAAYGEYHSEDIWKNCCTAVRTARESAGVPPEAIIGIGFDATCSLVFLDRDGAPLPVSMETGAPRNTMAWFDHRGLSEAVEISSTGHPVLAYSGGGLSPEMEIPKLMWLKRHRPELWEQVGSVYDLADYLTWRASGTSARSQSTLTSKWNYLGHESAGWHDDFFALAGLEDVRARTGLPDAPSEIGACVDTLTARAASELGLTTSCRVATGMVDAHAGALGLLGAHLGKPDTLTNELALVAGTSSCILGLSPDTQPIPGIWGPYFGAAAPDLWLVEGGQSAAGALLDHVIRTHSAGGAPTAERHAQIVARIAALRADPERHFAEGLHVLPDYHGNRSPYHMPTARGAIVGMSLEPGFDGLCALYWRAAVGLAMNLRQILGVMRQNGFSGDRLHVAGGHSANALLMELYAGALGIDVVSYSAVDALLVGMAMGVSVAAGAAPDLASAGHAMQITGTPLPAPSSRRIEYEADYAAYLRLQAALVP